MFRVIQVGGERFPRWMIFDAEHGLYWRRAVCSLHSRDGTLFHEELDARLECGFARIFAGEYDDSSIDEDEDEENYE